ncbi:MAG: protein phosphatase 2C domain-containing protein [Coriobacteriales bacterium]|nr:protein phosphatase 2C domain-containing protein [Coriobacteriales bacterium]
MDFISTYHTDVGIKKKTNQDSLFLAEAQSAQGKVFLAVICDGMGGLSQGEVASAALARAFQDWFRTELPHLLQEGIASEALCASWHQLINGMNTRVLEYSALNHVSLGTTVVALLLVEGRFFILNVGDSRVYRFFDALLQLTKDQTVVQSEVDRGLLTPEQAQQDSRRNVLLQCVGASTVVEPEFTQGSFEPGSLFMLCSDGFRHLITPAEFWEALDPGQEADEQQLYNSIVYLTDMNKYRREEDNISAIVVKAQ